MGNPMKMSLTTSGNSRFLLATLVSRFAMVCLKQLTGQIIHGELPAVASLAASATAERNASWGRIAPGPG